MTKFLTNKGFKLRKKGERRDLVLQDDASRSDKSVRLLSTWIQFRYPITCIQFE